MSQDTWKSYSDFKQNNELSKSYYDLVGIVFEEGVRRVCRNSLMENALDLGCGSGEFTQRLKAYVQNITGIDFSPGLIQKASQNANIDNLNFILGDVLDETVISQFIPESYDLITAAWLHNHLDTEQKQQKLMQTILRLLKTNGCFVFLIPSLGFTTPQAQQLFSQLGWFQAWLDESNLNKHGVYRFGESPWQELWVWQPMWLARLYSTNFDISFLDVKTIALNHKGLGKNPIEPPFEVMMGWRKAF